MKTIKTKSRYRFLTILPALIVMVVIFFFSAQPAVQSSGLSAGILLQITESLEKTLHVDYSITPGTALFHFLEVLIRKGAHMTEYAILAITISFPLYIHGKSGRKLVLNSEVICFLYAVTDEFHQIFVPGRSGQIADVVIDGFGAFLGCLLFVAVTKLFCKRSLFQ